MFCPNCGLKAHQTKGKSICQNCGEFKIVARGIMMNEAGEELSAKFMKSFNDLLGQVVTTIEHGANSEFDDIVRFLVFANVYQDIEVTKVDIAKLAMLTWRILRFDPNGETEELELKPLLGLIRTEDHLAYFEKQMEFLFEKFSRQFELSVQLKIKNRLSQAFICCKRNPFFVESEHCEASGDVAGPSGSLVETANEPAGSSGTLNEIGNGENEDTAKDSNEELDNVVEDSGKSEDEFDILENEDD